MIRLLPALAMLVLAVVVTWNIARRTAPGVATPLPATATAAPSSPTPPRTGAPATSPTAAAPFRLAGTVVGDVRYAIIEAPDGSNDLYGIDAEVPGLGKLVAVGPKSATFEGRDGRFEMKLLAAPTATPAPLAPDQDDEGYLDEYELDQDEEFREDELGEDYELLFDPGDAAETGPDE